MYRTLEVIFRRLIRLLLLLVCLPLVSMAVIYLLPRSYETTAALWALRHYEITDPTQPQNQLDAITSTTPAATQATAFTELLQTHDIAIAIAKSTNLAATLSLSKDVLSNPALLNDALFDEISHHVLVQAQGYNLFVVSYTHRNPVVAQQIVAAAIKSYSQNSREMIMAKGHQQLLQSYQQQLQQARHSLNNAEVAEARYLAAHPNLSQDALRNNSDGAILSDSQYASLHSQTKQAQAAVDTISTNITALQQEIIQEEQSANSLFRIVDQPVVARQPVSRLKLLLTAFATGLALALLACAVYVIILVRRDRVVYTVRDLQKITNVPVVMQLPSLSSEARASLLNRSLIEEKCIN